MSEFISTPKAINILHKIKDPKKTPQVFYNKLIYITTVAAH